jgi:hypothetical protein
MDTCYISYIFTETTGFRKPFSKDLCVQKIAYALTKLGSLKNIILFRFSEIKGNPIITTSWCPVYYKIVDHVFPTWKSTIKYYPENTILLTPRGNFKLKDVNQKFFYYCEKNHIMKK